MTITHILDHDQRAINRLVSALISDPLWQSLLIALVSEHQALEDVFFELFDERLLINAEGVQLDNYGVLVGQRRNGLTDDEYRAVLSTRILANRGSGQIPNITKALSDLTGGAAVKYRQLDPASFALTFFSDDALSTTMTRIIIEMMDDMRPAGVELASIVQAEGVFFQYDGEAGYDLGAYMGLLT